MVQININGINREMTTEELAEYNQIQADFEATRVENKLKQIRAMRDKKLQETDYLGASDQTMSEAMKTRRQEWRDLPQNNTTEEQYDALLESIVNSGGNGIGMTELSAVLEFNYNKTYSRVRELIAMGKVKKIGRGSAACYYAGPALDESIKIAAERK